MHSLLGGMQAILNVRERINIPSQCQCEAYNPSAAALFVLLQSLKGEAAKADKYDEPAFISVNTISL